jgi:hypothetical protein
MSRPFCSGLMANADAEIDDAIFLRSSQSGPMGAAQG